LRRAHRYAIVVHGEGREPEEFQSVQLASNLTVDQHPSKEHDHGDEEEKKEEEDGKERQDVSRRRRERSRLPLMLL
jgi:hypothetical protein